MSERSNLQIAIDGPAASGKSTVGRGLAERLGCRYLDTGLMYRAVTWLASLVGIAFSDGTALAMLAASTEFDLSETCEDHLLVDGVLRKDALRTPAVDASVSEVSAHREVREALVEKQRALAAKGCIVMVGRDIGTVVLPDATVKLWVTATPYTRALRRNKERHTVLDPEQVRREMEAIAQRDQKDETRAISPLRKADDAIVVETDDRTAQETVEIACALIARRLEGRA